MRQFLMSALCSAPLVAGSALAWAGPPQEGPAPPATAGSSGESPASSETSGETVSQANRQASPDQADKDGAEAQVEGGRTRPDGSPLRWPPKGEVEQEDPRTIVVSTGTRTDRDAATAPVSTTVITREEIVSSGAESVAEVLEESASGIQTSSSFRGTALSMRGLEAEQILILVDGQRVTGRIGGAIDLERFTVENVERIEIVYGAGSVLHGSDALGGVVNIITRRPEPGIQAEVHGAYGSRNTADATARIAGAMRRFGLYATGGYHRTDGWDADTSDQTTTGDRWSQWNVGAGGHLTPIRGLRIDLSGEYLQRDSQGIDVTATGAVIDRRNLTETINVTLAPQWSGPDSRLRVALHYNYFRDQFRQDQRGDDQLDRYEPTRDQIAQLQVQYDQMAGKHVFSTGADVQLEWLETTRVLEEGVLAEVERQRIAIFVQDEWTPTVSPRVVVLPSLRLDYDTQFGLYPTGRLALLVAPIDTLTFRVAYGRGYRAPSFRELYLAFANPGVGYRVAGNPSLRPEQAWTLDLGVSWLPTKWATLSATVFDNQLRDLITVDLASEGSVDQLDVFSYINVGSAVTRGAEATASISPLPYLEFRGSYTYLIAREHGTDRPLPGRTPHQGSFAAEFDKRNWGTRLLVRGRVTGRRPFSVGEDEFQFADPFVSLDMRVSQSFLRYFTAFFGIDNIVGAGDALTNPLVPRSFYGGLTFRY